MKFSKQIYVPSVFLLLVALLLMQGCSSAGLTRAQKVSAKATKLQKKGKAEKAQKLLDKTLEECGKEEQSKSCRALINYTQGYIYKMESVKPIEKKFDAGRGGLINKRTVLDETTTKAAVKATKEAFLKESIKSYMNVLKDSPGHGPTLYSLALIYIEMDDLDKAEFYLKEAIAADKKRGPSYALRLGDLWMDRGEPTKALDVYKTAVKMKPGASTPRRRVIKAYRELPKERWRELFELASEWEANPASAKVAAEGYAAVMDLTYLTDTGMAERSLVRWVGLMGRKGWLSLGSLNALPAGWKPAAVEELKGYLDVPDSGIDRSGWWASKHERRQAIAEAAFSIGARRLRKVSAQEAEAVWKAGVEVAPRYHDYHEELKECRLIRLELQTELAALYNKYPALDEEGNKLEAIVQDLFRKKGAAYARKDMEAVQRHHTVLGIIYAENGVWRSEHYAANAIFQLEHAIRTAERREAESGFYQPLPKLKAFLAEGYASIEERTMACATYLKAAEAYLDTDQLDKAEKMLGLAKGQAGPGDEDEAREIQLSNILEARQEIAEGEYTGFFDKEIPELSESFLARQRFKALSDMARTAKRSGDSALTEKYAAEAYSVAFKSSPSIIGIADRLRFSKIERWYLAAFSASYEKPKKRRAYTPLGAIVKSDSALSMPETTKGEYLSYSSPGKIRPAFIKVNPDAVKVYKINTILEGKSEIGVKKFTFDPKSSTVNLSSSDDEEGMQEAIDKIEALKGVDRVLIRPDEPHL
jgi:tetratricopeptide (TPR) repeat protein